MDEAEDASIVPVRPSLAHRYALNGIDAAVLAGCAAIAWFDTGIMRWSGAACAVYLIGWKLIRLIAPKLPTTVIDRLTPGETEYLLAKLRVVESWLAEFCSGHPPRRRPRVLIALTGFISYAPVSNTMSIPPSHFTSLTDQDLRLAVAHELGHAQRRWISALAMTIIGKVKEEILADRFALTVTGADPAAWAHAMRAVAVLEDNALGDDDLEFMIRQRAVVAWCERRAQRGLESR